MVTDLTIKGETLGQLKADLVSDRIPIVISIGTLKPQEAPKRLARWITRHPLFSDLRDGAIGALPGGDPWGRLAASITLQQLDRLVLGSATSQLATIHYPGAFSKP